MSLFKILIVPRRFTLPAQLTSQHTKHSNRMNVQIQFSALVLIVLVVVEHQNFFDETFFLFFCIFYRNLYLYTYICVHLFNGCFQLVLKVLTELVVFGFQNCFMFCFCFALLFPFFFSEHCVWWCNNVFTFIYFSSKLFYQYTIWLWQWRHIACKKSHYNVQHPQFIISFNS